MGSYFGISTEGSTDIDQLVNAYRNTKQSQIDTLDSKKSELESARSFFTTFNSRISSLLNALDNFTTDDAADKFVTRKIASTNTSYVSASVNNTANIGSVNLNVNRLATSDTLISNRLNLEDNYGVSAGDYSFTLSSGDSTFDVSYSLDGTETNEEAMNKIVNAINNIEDINISASMIKDTSSTGRITLVSNNTGEDYAIEISSNDNGLSPTDLDSNFITNPPNRKTASDTKAGYAKADTSLLNSQVTVNGINVERNSNSIDDLITGTTINLKQAQETDSIPISLSTEIDTDQVANLISPLLTTYNAALTHLASDRDLKRSDSSVSTLHSRLRSLSTQAINVEGSSENRYLMEIGINVQSDGTLKITDKDKLQTLLEEDPQKVADLFIGENGFVNKVQTAIEGLYGSDGLIQSRRDALTRQIDSTENRTKEIEKRIDQEAENLRKQYTSYLETFYEAQSQYSLLSTMSSGSSSGYDSLLAQSYGY